MFVLVAEVIIVHAELPQRSEQPRSSHEQDLYSFYCHSDTGT